MRKVFLFMMTSVDGYFEAPGHDLSWHNVDEEFNEFALNQLDEADLLVFGGRTYEMMASYWPMDDVKRDDPEVASRMNGARKIAFSQTIKESIWENSRVYFDNPSGVLNEEKKQEGKSIAVLGSSNLCVTLLEEGVLDEVRIMVNPVVLGKGTPLFSGIEESYSFTLTNTRTFDSGNVLLTYSVNKK